MSPFLRLGTIVTKWTTSAAEGIYPTRGAGAKRPGPLAVVCSTDLGEATRRRIRASMQTLEWGKGCRAATLTLTGRKETIDVHGPAGSMVRRRASRGGWSYCVVRKRWLPRYVAVCMHPSWRAGRQQAPFRTDMAGRVSEPTQLEPGVRASSEWKTRGAAPREKGGWLAGLLCWGRSSWMRWNGRARRMHVCAHKVPDG